MVLCRFYQQGNCRYGGKFLLYSMDRSLLLFSALRPCTSISTNFIRRRTLEVEVGYVLASIFCQPTSRLSRGNGTIRSDEATRTRAIEATRQHATDK